MLGRGASGKKTGVIKKREWEGGCNKHQQHGVDGESLAKRKGSAGGFEATVGGEEERLIWMQQGLLISCLVNATIHEGARSTGGSATTPILANR